MFTTYILPIIAFASLGLLAGVLLTFASKFFEVKVDERIEKVNDVLPQANCGACGYAGCADYANAVVTQNAPTNLCKPGGPKVVEGISNILGTAAMESVQEVAFVHCSGDSTATGYRYNFDGIQACSAVKRFYSGNSTCPYGCLGLGDCSTVCEYNAIYIKDSIAHINPEKCIACGKCVTVCPNNLITMKPKNTKVVVACTSRDNGKATKLSCKNGCIGCKMCEKKCQHDAIKVMDFHAIIDYNKCVDCGECATVCPVKVIHYDK